jgi:NADPH-dependent glutamate synthase beta subunit-like oxidoreductase
VTGWLKRGPTGIIGSNIPDAKETVTSLLQDLSLSDSSVSVAEVHIDPVDKISQSNPDYKQIYSEKSISWDMVKRLDAVEVIDGQKIGKIREKLTYLQRIQDIAHGVNQ